MEKRSKQKSLLALPPPMAMEPMKAKLSQSSIAPPRTLDVQKFAEARASELDSLHSIISARLNNDFRIRRDKRRRTTSHRTKNQRRLKRRKMGTGDESLHEEKEDQEMKKVSRRTRRRLEFQSNPASGFTTAGNGTKRLRTHLWHAKRFTMVKRWGFYLPLGLHGRGRNSRAVLKWFRHGGLVHDASYCLPIELVGLQESIVATLRMVLFPSPTMPPNASEKLSDSVTNGACYENAMLFHIEEPLSKPVAPVIYMWQPSSGSDHINAEKDEISNSFGGSHEDECNSSTRKLWIWIHAAAFDEGLYVLDNARQKMNECAVNVRCSTLEGQVARLDVMGFKATKMLMKTLHPVSKSFATADDSLLNVSFLTPCNGNSATHKSFVLSHADKLPSRTILSLTVCDPRDLQSGGTEVGDNELPLSFDSDLLGEDSSWSNPQTNETFFSDNRSLWDFGNNLYPPIPESIFCKEKHDRRLKDLYLEPSSQAAIEAKDVSHRTCPILLLKHAEYGSFCMGWSIILPLCWVKSFWMSLVSNGFRAIGLRERRWVACNSGLPSFPFDFPDCKAYSSYKVDEAAAFDRASEHCPPAVRPLKVPIPPPWYCIGSTLRKGPNILQGFWKLPVKTSTEVLPKSSIVDLHWRDISSSSECQVATKFPGFVPRTFEVLDGYFEKIGCKNLLSPPTIQNMKRGLPDCAKTSFNIMDTDSEHCFIRVLLHAHKKGVFEEGALVCAPLLTDLSRWTRSDGEEEGEELHIPQSSMRSCFKEEQSTGKWELVGPEDCSTMQSFRWPIGFVTTGFVRGSTKPVAVALCEAKFLAMLRAQQISELRAQQLSETQIAESKLFLFVRNMSSTVYRRAQAIVVLEHQNDDLEFM